MNNTNTLPAPLTTVENEYDKAMLAQKQFSETDPVEYAVSELTHDWKVNRYNMCGYKSTLEFFMKDDNWNEIKEKILAKGLPVDPNLI